MVDKQINNLYSDTTITRKNPEKKNYHVEVYVFLLILFLTYLTIFYNYLLFHTIAELFSIVIGGGIFIICWNSRKRIDNSFFLVIGVSFLYVGFLDFVHSLAYTGMNIFTGYDTNLPTQLWITARYVQAGSFLFASLMINKKIKINYLIIFYTITTFILLVLVFLKFFPDCFIEGTGLTPFKIISEYIIDFLLFITIFIIYKQRFLFERKIYITLFYSIIATIVAELSFTLYAHAYGIPNLIGHIFKIISFFFLYKAIINIGLENPINFLFRKLKLSEKNLIAKASDLEKANFLLKEAELRYRTTFEQSPDGIIILDPKTLKAVEFNDEICNILGYTRKEFANLTIPDYDANENPKDTEIHVNKILGEGRDDFETKFLTKYGEIKDIYVTAKVIKLSGETYFQSICRDITEQKKAAELKTRLASIVESSEDAIISKTLDGIITSWNKAAEKIYYYSAEEVLGKSIELLSPPSQESEILEILTRIKSGEKLEGFETERIRKDGSKVNVSLTISPIKDRNNIIIGASTIARDITEKKKAENRLKRLISTVSHELRTPITVLLMSMDYLKNYKKDIQPEVEVKLMDGIDRNVKLLHKLADNILMISRIDEKRVDIDWIEYHPLEIINNILTLMEPIGKKKNLNFKIDIHKNLTLKGDSKRIDQIFRIFIDNAIKYSKENSTIEINAFDDYKGKYNLNGNNGVLFQFKDTGIGISEDELPHIFERFYRSKNVSEIPGSGLGLSIAEELIQLHKGEVFVESKLNEGSTFYIFLPRLNHSEK
ncbi:MAG: MASE3 domain-containing protein [Promethearchaeota archaeon]